MKHLWEGKRRVIHGCESSEIQSHITLVWTKCEIDVPANKSFKSNEFVTCDKCIINKEKEA